MSKRSPITVLVVDDQAVFRNALRAFLKTDKAILVIGEAKDGEEGVRKADELSPDVVLMDLTLPGVDGFEATKQIRDAHPETPVLLLSGITDTRMRLLARHAGAAGLVEKSHALEELVPAIKAIAAATVLA